MRILSKRGRQTGKTYDLITLAARHNGIIVVADLQRAVMVERMAEARGLTIRQPLVAGQIQRHHFEGHKDDQPLYIDDFDHVLSTLLGHRRIDTVTWNGPS